MLYDITKLGIIPNLGRGFMSNYSKQRECIINIIRNLRTHPTAEEIYMKVKQVDEKISRSTVYRNINILVENGEVTKISMPVGPDRYDYNHEMHNHIICEKCGKVYDFYYDIPKSLKNEIQNQLLGKISLTDSIEINGICYECKSKKEK